MRSLVLAGWVTATLAAATTLTSAPAYAAHPSSVHCCGQLISGDSKHFRHLAEAFGIAPGIAKGKTVSTNCEPVTHIGVGSDIRCNQDLVVCRQDAADGLIGIDCKPVVLG